MPRTPYAQLPQDEKDRQRRYKRESAKKIRKRRIEVFASSEDILILAHSKMPHGLSLAEFLSQLVDRVAAGSLIPRPPSPK
jgi:hypothetical protein